MTESMPSSGPVTSGPFTSGLSAGESLLVQDAGFEPAGLVMGFSVVNLGLYDPVRSVAQLTGPSYGTLRSVVPRDGGEVVILSKAMSTARKKALERLRADARELGADGVIDIHAETTWDSWYDGALEFVLTGTAVRRVGAPGAPGTPESGPDPEPERDADGEVFVFTCDLSGQDFWALQRSGYRVLGFVMGYCAYTAEPEHAVINRELRGSTKAVYAARELAVSRMRTQAGYLRASGIVGVQLGGLDGLSALPDRRTLEFRATGTAIKVTAGTHDMPAPISALSL